MRTRKSAAVALMRELKAAYAAMDAEPYGSDPDRSAQAVGRYDGLKQAYILLTGRDEGDVASEVVAWYIGTPEYQAVRERYGLPRKA